MLHTSNIKAFLASLDTATTKDETRACLCSINLLKAFKNEAGEDMERLLATDGFVLVIVDVSADLMAYAVKNAYILKKVNDDGRICYFTVKKAGLSEDTLFSYPDVMRVIPNLTPSSFPPIKLYSRHSINRACEIRAAFNSYKKDRHTYFAPTHISESPEQGDVYVENGLFILVMPLKRVDTNKDIAPINDYLPGLIDAP